MKICLGIAGSIAAYRSADVVKRLVAEGHEVRCVLTEGGKQFVTEKVLETFSNNRVLSSDVFDSSHFATDHISVARWADTFLVYGATANFLGRFAAGLGDDFLTLQLLAFRGPVVIAPAMNPEMWANPLVQQNYVKLKDFGYRFVEPISGRVACGEEGVGHVATDDQILSVLSIDTKTNANPLSGIAGKKILISAGPMRTEVDPVRFVQNRSSGKMGLALARACRNSGASEVVVLLGPVSADIRKEFSGFTVKTYAGPKDYEAALDALFPDCDVFFSAAAVLDFESLPSKKKIERSEFERLTRLEMEIRSVPDIVAKFGALKAAHQKVIAFAAESGSELEILERARKKMTKKGADAMIANPVWSGLGPESDENQVWILRPDLEPVKLGPASKESLSQPILDTLFTDA